MRGSNVLLLLFINATTAHRVVGWWEKGVPALDSPVFPWGTYTHLRYGGPVLSSNVTATCNHTQMDPVVSKAHAEGVSVLWGPSLPGQFIQDGTTPDTYWRSIGEAVRACNVDGIEVDYEVVGEMGVVSPAAATHYTKWLARLRSTIGKPVSADISIWGIAPGNYVLGVLPWVNVSMLNEGAFDWVNTMSYHWNENGDIWAWKKDVWFLTTVWGIHPSRINLGIPYFSKQWANGHLISEPTWNGLSPHCPHVSPLVNACNGTRFVGKQMNLALGRFVHEQGIGGVFPWELSYDSYEDGNTLSPFLLRGLRGE
jgi:GH18 family chitinase